MTYNNLHYCIINRDDVKCINFACVKETGPDTLRRSIDGTKTFVKYEGDQPDCLFEIAGNLTGLPEYTHEEILEILKGSEWSKQDSK
jgi:hypothetical protein